MEAAGGFLIHERVIYPEMGNKTKRNKAADSRAKNPAMQIGITTGPKVLQEQPPNAVTPHG